MLEGEKNLFCQNKYCFPDPGLALQILKYGIALGGDGTVLETCESKACSDVERNDRQMPLRTFECNAV